MKVATGVVVVVGGGGNALYINVLIIQNIDC